MIRRDEILEFASQFSLRPQVVEKDYVLGWLLAGIYAQEELASAWVFKGGTCLKKCYFETYRFSEDLDFTVAQAGKLNSASLRGSFERVCEWVYEQTGIEIPKGEIRFDVFHNSRGGVSAEGRIYYRGPIAPRGDLPRIKLDLTEDEVLVLNPQKRQVDHPYSDKVEALFETTCYSYEEIFGEKIRALAERTRPRDLYDVINLFRREESGGAAQTVLTVLKRKCEFKGIPVPTLIDLGPNQNEVQADWEQMLAHQLPVLPPFGSFWIQLGDFFDWLLGERAIFPLPSLPPLREGHAVYGDLRQLGYPLGSRRILEAIRFAAFNRLCVDLDYWSGTGKRSGRLIEPYSLRRTHDGNILLFAVRADSGALRSYRVDRIKGATVSGQSFKPRFSVEFSQSGPLAVADRPAPIGPVRQPTAERSRRPTSPRIQRTRGSDRFGPTYVFQCYYCGRRFKRKSNNPATRAHARPDGYPCDGRSSFPVTIF